MGDGLELATEIAVVVTSTSAWELRRQMPTKLSRPIDPIRKVDVLQPRSKMPIASYPFFPMVLIMLVAAIIITVAIVQIYFEGSSTESQSQNKSNAAGVPVQSDAVGIKQQSNR